VKATTSFTVTVQIQTGTNQNDGAALVWVPGGSFTMGTLFSAAGPMPTVQRVTLTGYWIYQYQVTVAQYRAFCAATSHALPSFPTGYSWTGYSDWTASALQQMPIVNVSWFDCRDYADWAGVQLPTEAQYEYAARGPLGNNYPWGGAATAVDPDNGWDETKCANYDNSDAVGMSTWPVGSFPAGASWCGAQDLAGNVWEWCSDWWGNYSATPVTNPTGAVTGIDRVLRGGSWYNNGDYCRGAYRDGYSPDGWDTNYGFRCVAISPTT